jgi:SAM-dependent methyltransferase
MKETTKCHDIRQQRGDFDNYLHGLGIDVGAGDDVLVVPHGSVMCWDVEQGDGQYLASVPDQSMDFVYSSHCLEHLVSVNTALTNWYRVLKPGGWLYAVVPDYTLYEKHRWPSAFNGDHKHSFSTWLSRYRVGRSNHWHTGGDLVPVMQRIGFQGIHIQLEDFGFDYNQGHEDQTLKLAVAQICIVAQRGELVSDH